MVVGFGVQADLSIVSPADLGRRSIPAGQIEVKHRRDAGSRAQGRDPGRAEIAVAVAAHFRASALSI
jgi:hypothetical protein